MSTPTIHTIPARRGTATLVSRGQSVKIINTHGTQVIDTWAFSTSRSSSTMSPPAMQYLSMQHTHASLNKLIPEVGDTMTSNERKPMLTVVEDTTDGVHDTLIAACDRWRYEELGGEEGHRNCADNLAECLSEIDILVGLELSRAYGVEQTAGATTPPFTPSPLNLFMNIPVHEDRRTISFEAPTCKPGQYIVLRAEMDLVIAFSACPQDILKINCGKPVDAHYQVL